MEKNIQCQEHTEIYLNVDGKSFIQTRYQYFANRYWYYNF